MRRRGTATAVAAAKAAHSKRIGNREKVAWAILYMILITADNNKAPCLATRLWFTIVCCVYHLVLPQTTKWEEKATGMDYLSFVICHSCKRFMCIDPALHFTWIH